MGIFDKLFKRHSQEKENLNKEKKSLSSEQNDEKVNAKSTPFPDRHKLILWKIDMIEKAIASGDVDLVNKNYAGLIETVRQQNINTNGELDEYLNTIREEYKSFREKFNVEYPKECLPPEERKEESHEYIDGEKLELHAANMREATRLKETGNLNDAIALIYKSQQQTGILNYDKLSSYLSKNGNVEEAVKVLKDGMSKKFPYNNHSHCWEKISSIYFRNNDMESYLYALTMSIFYQVIHTFTIIGDKNLVNEFYEEQSIEYVGASNLSRFIKKINKPDFFEKYNTILMSFFDEIKPLILKNCRFRLDDKFTKKEMLFFNKYNLDFFDTFYHEKIEKIVFDDKR